MPTMLNTKMIVKMPNGETGEVMEILPIGELRIRASDGTDYYYYPDDVEEVNEIHPSAYYADRDEW